MLPRVAIKNTCSPEPFQYSSNHFCVHPALPLESLHKPTSPVTASLPLLLFLFCLRVVWTGLSSSLEDLFRLHFIVLGRKWTCGPSHYSMCSMLWVQLVYCICVCIQCTYTCTCNMYVQYSTFSHVHVHVCTCVCVMMWMCVTVLWHHLWPELINRYSTCPTNSASMHERLSRHVG